MTRLEVVSLKDRADPWLGLVSIGGSGTTGPPEIRGGDAIGPAEPSSKMALVDEAVARGNAREREVRCEDVPARIVEPLPSHISGHTAAVGRLECLCKVRRVDPESGCQVGKPGSGAIFMVQDFPRSGQPARHTALPRKSEDMAQEAEHKALDGKFGDRIGMLEFLVKAPQPGGCGGATQVDILRMAISVARQPITRQVDRETTGPGTAEMLLMDPMGRAVDGSAGCVLLLDRTGMLPEPTLEYE